MKLLGFVMLAVGMMLVLASFGSDTAPEGTHNIGLMQQQLMLFQLGGLVAAVGSLFAAVGIILARLAAAGIIPPAGIRANADV